MGNNKEWKVKDDSARSRQEAYRTGKELGYHLGYNMGYESGFEKGYSEGSTLGYNNGFLAALRVSEGAGVEDSSCTAGLPYSEICHAVRKLVESGRVRIFLSGSASREAQMLLKLLSVDGQVMIKDLTEIR